jgi:hypothetical protein
MIEFFSDDFEKPHDYVADNVTGTGRDGYFGWLPGETVDALNASINRKGQLYLESPATVWFIFHNASPLFPCKPWSLPQGRTNRDRIP